MLEEQSFDSRKILVDIKNHVVQVENLVLAVILFIGIISLKDVVAATFGAKIAAIIPLLFLAIVPTFVRVTNPPSDLRSKLTWGLGASGVGGTFGAAADLILFPLTGIPVGTLIGGIGGFIGGTAAAGLIDKTPEVLTQGEAREFLISIRKHHPGLEIKTIIDATERPSPNPKCAVFMFLSDGVIKCSKDDIFKWLKSECWKYPDRQSPNVP